MQTPSQHASRVRIGSWTILILTMAAVASLHEPLATAQEKSKAGQLQEKRKGPLQQKLFGGPGFQPARPVAPPAPKSALLTSEDWQIAPMTPLQAGEIDRLILKELRADKIDPAPLTTDEQFLRRVTLDLTGQLPVPAEITEFVASTDPQKRSKVIDKLLSSDEYARHWARYWRDVIASRISDRRGLALGQVFEEWMVREIQANAGWDAIARAMLTAEGDCRFDDEEGKTGAAFLLASRMGNDAPNEQASETARIFLGMQIQCAQCHDHPFDQWKRVQFHELAGYFARVRERPIQMPMQRPEGIRLISLPRGEHEMPSKDDPKKTFITHPRFLDGKSPGTNLSDLARRKALAEALTAKSNYWFAGAYVNRIWGELMGQAFYMPVDNMGPQKEAVFPAVLTRLTGAFRGSNFDMREMFRSIANSQAYQRQARLGDSADEHLHFAAAYPTRLRANAIWDALVSVLGNLAGPPGAMRRPPGPFVQRFGLEGAVKDEFELDPSTKADEVEGSIPQALLLMNNPQINGRIMARGTNVLARILNSYPDDSDALRMLYLKTLARKPTDRELARARSYIASSKTRAEGYEDLLWALLNTTEFQTKR